MEEIKFGGLRLYWLKDKNGKNKKYDTECKKCGGKIIFGKRHNQFSKGFKITVDSILGLYCHLRDLFGLKFLMCSHCDQDFEESFIGKLRASGQNRKPAALQLLYRIKRFMLFFTSISYQDSIILHFLENIWHHFYFYMSKIILARSKYFWAEPKRFGNGLKSKIMKEQAGFVV